MPVEGDKHPNTEENVNRAPLSHGVYQFYESQTVTYIGHASGTGVTVRSRLQAHKLGAEGLCTRTATHFKYEETETAISREEALLSEYTREHGQLPRCNDGIRGGAAG